MAATAANIVEDPHAGATPAFSSADAAELVERLRASFNAGKTRPLAWRREQLKAVRRLLTKNARPLAAALAEDLGKPEFEAHTTDVAFPISEASIALKNLQRWTRPEKAALPAVQRPAKAYTVFEPLGVVLVIAPWNYPVQLVFNPLVAAIAAGNCAIVKPSELTPKTSALIAKLIREYLDGDCIAVVEGAVDETTALLEQRFDHIFYTGNGRVARVVMEAAAKHLTPTTLELGGKSPCVVAADADLATAARRIAWGKFTNAGQTCTAPDYVLVERAAAAELTEKLAATITEFYGADPKASPDFARIVSRRHAERLAAMLDDGATKAAGGDVDLDERYVAPTLLTDVSTDSKVMDEEIFGPILPILAVDDLDEAIDTINRGDKPLALYVFGADKARCDRVLASTSSGGACVNATLWHVANPNLPFGGVGESGMGAYHGRYGFERLSHRKAVTEKPTRMDPKVGYPPYSRIKLWLAKRFM